MLNAESYFDNYNYTPIYEQVLKESKVASDDNHLQRHTIEIKKKVEEIKKTYKTKEYFKDMPTLDNDFSSYIILTNMPFVEEEKRDKFKMYMNKKLGEDMEKKIKEYIFPYSNDDKDYFANNSFIILKFGSYEEAKLASIALNDFQIDKSHKINPVTYIDYDNIISMQDSYIPPNYFSFLDLVNWEESNLIEMFMARRNNSLLIGKLHYLKKELSTVVEIPCKHQNVTWTPQGKYLAINEGNCLKFYGGTSSFNVKLELDYVIKDFLLSNDENYVITFSGYAEKENQKQNVFIWDLLRKELIRDLTITKEESFSNFKWSKDSKYFGRIKKDILIVYEAPKMQMLPDSQGVRQPIKDNVKEFYWFPNKNNIVTISEKRSGNKLSESILQFFEMPSRKSFLSSSLSGLEIFALEWHKNNINLAVLCKSTDKNPKWSVRIFELDNVRHSFRSAHTNIVIGDGTGQFYFMSIKWMGNDLFIAPKFKDNNLDTMHIIPYKMDKKTLQISPWPEENFLKNLKHSHFLPSPNEVHFLLTCLDQNNTNSYGKIDLFVIDSGKLNFSKSFEFTNNLESVKWDQGGRLFMIELTRKQQEGVRFFDCEGNLIYDYKGDNLISAIWRPRHLPVLDRNAEESDIKKNFKNISKYFEEEDSQFLSAIEQFKRNERKQIRDRFMAVVNKRRELWNETKEEREKLFKEAEPVYVEHEYVLEEIIHTVEEIISTD